MAAYLVKCKYRQFKLFNPQKNYKNQTEMTLLETS